MSYWPEFLAIVTAHALAVASPGPDFALVLRQSLAHGRRTAIWTSLGIGCGIAVHISYCLLGLGFVLAGSPVVLTVVKYLGAAYLAYVGIQALRSRPRTNDINLSDNRNLPSARAAWLTGFLVNVLNPKAGLFFLSLFPLVVGAGTPKWIQLGYGLWMVVATPAWFSMVSVVFTKTEMRRKFLHYGHWIDRALGLVFLAFSFGLLFTAL